MCNRLRSIHRAENTGRALAALLRLNWDANPNVAPTDLAPMIPAGPGGPSPAIMGRFGIMLTGKDGKPRPPLLNATTDGLRKGQYKSLMQENRCIIPVDGLYEWRKEDGGKQPYLFHRKDGQLLETLSTMYQSRKLPD